ncbi:hypothetical protein BKA60DRAFT_583801 [Fusarium oxysporum]|nr:hypothetical protein BKA60DRAFT_583801 [Fusarium oxysporum]
MIWFNMRILARRQELFPVLLLLLLASLIALTSVRQRPKEERRMTHHFRSTILAMKASTGIAFRGIPFANIKEGRGQGGYGNTDSISKKTAPVTNSDFAKRVTRRRLRSPTCMTLHLRAKQTVIWKISTGS